MLRRRAPLLAAVVAVATLAPAALAGWGAIVDAGPQPLASVQLAAPTAVGAARGGCTRFQASSLTVGVTWTATTTAEATGYAIRRSTSAAGPYAQVGTVSGVTTTSWSDVTGTLAFGRKYYYVVESTVQAWTSADSVAGSVTTPSNRCR